MGRNSRQRALSETREQLFAAGERLFAERGYAETKVEAIATEAGFTRGAFYCHFPSKEEFFLALLERRSATQHAEWADLVEARKHDGLTAVGAWYEMNLRRQRGFDAAVQEFTAYASRRPELLERLREQERELLRTIDRHLSQSAGTAMRPDELAALVLAIGEGLAVQLTLPRAKKRQLFTTALAALAPNGLKRPPLPGNAPER